MKTLKAGEQVLARTEYGVQRGEVVEVFGSIWDRWYGVQIRTITGNITYYFRRRELIRLTSV